MNEYLRKSTCTKCASSDLLEGFTMMEKNVKKKNKNNKAKQNRKKPTKNLEPMAPQTCYVQVL